MSVFVFVSLLDFFFLLYLSCYMYPTQISTIFTYMDMKTEKKNESKIIFTPIHISLHFFSPFPPHFTYSHPHTTFQPNIPQGVTNRFFFSLFSLFHAAPVLYFMDCNPILDRVGRYFIIHASINNKLFHKLRTYMAQTMTSVYSSTHFSLK